MTNLTHEKHVHILDGLRYINKFHGMSSSTVESAALMTWLQNRGFAEDESTARTVLDSLITGDGIPGLTPSTSGTVHASSVSSSGPKRAVLNEFLPTPPTARPLSDVLADCTAAFTELCADVLARDGHEVLYADVPAHPAWARYLVHAEELASATASPEMDDDARKSGFFNLYNSLIIHAKLVYGHPTSLSRRGTFFNSAAYTVCGVRLSSPDLEHMVLRRKAAAGSPLAPFMVAEKDPRMHFVLNCGARSCPPIRPISPGNAEADIVANTEYFIRKHCVVDPSKRKLSLSRLWKWFRNDFTPGTSRNAALLAWICANAPDDVHVVLKALVTAMQANPAMDGGDADEDEARSPPPVADSGDGKVKIKFERYDWADNGDWDAPKDDGLMAIYDASFALNK